MDQKDEVKNRIDIAELISGYVQLTPAGTNLKARCPFHTEKSPSFMVSRDKGIWHCFGCGKGGDVFSFVQEIEGLDFLEALRMLAQKAGVELSYSDPKLQSKKQRLFDLLKLAARVYHRLLLEHPKADQPRKYLEKRGMSSETIDTFQIGYAPESWEGVSKYLLSKGFSDEEIFQSGLTVRREQRAGFYDRFRHRIMFPVHDHLGRVVGFGGRSLEPNQTPKYVNTPQTALYNKSGILYGLHLAKTAIKSQKSAVLVEGYMDAIASHQAGVQCAVASSGTALTSDQLKLLHRYTQTIALAFDMDLAGQTASMRGIELAWAEGFDVRIVVLPSGKDPDELIRNDAAAWKTAVEQAQPILEYAFGKVEKTFHPDSVEEKKDAAKFLLPLIGKLQDTVEQTHYLQRLSALLRVHEDLLRSRIPQPFHGMGKSAARSTTAGSSVAHAPKSRVQRVAEQLLAIAGASPEHLEYLIDHLEPAHLSATNLPALYKALITYYTEKHALDQHDFLQSLGHQDPELANQANVIFLLGSSDLLPADDKLRATEVLNGVAFLQRSYLQAELGRIQQELAEAERNRNAERMTSLTQAAQDIARQLGDA